MQIRFNLAFSQTAFYLYNLDNGARCTETSVSFFHLYFLFQRNVSHENFGQRRSLDNFCKIIPEYLLQKNRWLYTGWPCSFPNFKTRSSYNKMIDSTILCHITSLLWYHHTNYCLTRCTCYWWRNTITRKRQKTLYFVLYVTISGT